MTDELPSWLTRAACRGATVTFFPERGESVDDARAICSTCPVRAECTAAALVANEGYGVWGGFSLRERERLRRLLAARFPLLADAHPSVDLGLSVPPTIGDDDPDVDTRVHAAPAGQIL